MKADAFVEKQCLKHLRNLNCVDYPCRCFYEFLTILSFLIRFSVLIAMLIFLLSVGRDSVRELSVLPLPRAHCLLVVQDESNLGNQTRVYRPPDTGSLVITPNEEVHYVQRPSFLIPGEKTVPISSDGTTQHGFERRTSLTSRPNTGQQTRIVDVPIPSTDGQLTLDDLINLMVTLRQLLGTPNTSPAVGADRPSAGVLPAPQSVTEISLCEQNAVSTSQVCFRFVLLFLAKLLL